MPNALRATLLAGLFAAASLFTACPDETEDPIGDDDDTVGDDDDTTDEPVYPDDPIGLFVLLNIGEDRDYLESTWFHGVLSPDTEWTEPVDPMGYLARQGYETFMIHNYWRLPEVGESLPTDSDEVDFDPAATTTLDGGERVLAGDDWEAYLTELDDGVLVYESDAEDAPPTGAFDGGGVVALELDGGPDVDAQVALGDVLVPAPLELLGDLDPTGLHVVEPTDDIVISWTPSGDPDATVVITAYGDSWGTIWHVLDDDGELTMTADEVQDFGGDFVRVKAARMITSEVETTAGVIQVRAIAESWLSFQQVETLGFFPQMGLTGTQMSLEVYRVTGEFVEGETTLDLGEGIFVDSVEVEPGGQVARAALIVDEDAETGPADLIVTTGEEVLEGPQPFMVYHPIADNDECEDAYIGPSLRPGFHYGTAEALSDTWNDGEGCPQYMIDVPGRDSFHRVDLQGGQMLSVTAGWWLGDMAMGLFDECGGELLECEDFSIGEDYEFLEYTATEDQTVYLLIDNTFDLPEDLVYMWVGIEEAADLRIWDNVMPQGESGTVEVTNYLWDFEQDQVTFDFGEGVTVTSVTVHGGVGPDADLWVEVAPDAPVSSRQVTATQGVDEVLSDVDGFSVAGLLPPSDSCATADALDALTTNWWYGDNTGLTDQAPDPAVCIGYSVPGADAIHRVELPAEGWGIELSMHSSFDTVVYLVDSCDPGTLPVACADMGGMYDLETLSFTAGPGEAGTYYLVVDSYSGDPGWYRIWMNVSE